MLLILIAAVFAFSVLLLGTGHFIIKDGTGASGFKIGGFVIMMILGLMVTVTGVSVEDGQATLNTSGGVTIVTPNYETLSNAEMFIGVPLMLMGLLGLFLTISYQRDSRNPYYEGGMKPPA